MVVKEVVKAVVVKEVVKEVVTVEEVVRKMGRDLLRICCSKDTSSRCIVVKGSGRLVLQSCLDSQ